MPEIKFEVLAPEAEITTLTDRFAALADVMGLSITSDPHITVDPDVERQLHEQLDDDAPRTLVGYTVLAESNLNQTAMTFARLLTPHVDLPAEPTLLENEELFEIPAIYPWTVTINP